MTIFHTIFCQYIRLPWEIVIFFNAVILLLLIPSSPCAASISPGFRCESLWLPDEQTKLDLAIWYPTLQKPTAINYGDWNLIVARGAKPLPGKYPAIILSHNSAGSRFSLHELATILAQKGFIVVAPTHQGDNADSMNLMFTKQQIVTRIHQINITINFLINDQELFDIIDTQKIGIIGVGTGGTIALLLAGAKLDPSGWWDYCQNIVPNSLKELLVLDPTISDTYCSSWVKPKMDILAQQIDPQTSYKNPRISAVISIAPSFGMLFSKDSLASICKPILLVEATNDFINIPKYHSQHIAKNLPEPHELSVLLEGSPSTLISACSDSLEQTLPEICSKDLDPTRSSIQIQIANTSEKFFINCFKND